LKQDQYSPLPVEEQVVAIYAAVNDFLKNVPIDRVKSFEREFLAYLHDNKPEILSSIRDEQKLTESNEEALKAELTQFLETFLA
jgi:F-type H+-transporting ATPase subunit alpha